MERSIPQDRLFPVVAPLVEKMGYRVVELISQRRRTGLQVHLVIHSPAGVGVQDCEEVYRAVLARVEVSEGRRDLHLEVSSPGLSRNLKSGGEFSLFVGRRVRVLMNDTAQWVAGTILKTDGDGVTLQIGGEELYYDYTKLHKARLEDAQEGGK